jgi:hypothetical protein
MIECLSKWIDFQLQRVIHLCPAYFKDTWALLDDLKQVGPLPPSARLFSLDAVSMYSNIPVTHALETINKWFQRHKKDLPMNFATELILDCLDIVMKNNVFMFGDLWFLQLEGTAMGTSCAVMYATIYESYYEEMAIIPTTHNNHANPHGLRFYRCFVDDTFGIMLDASPQNFSKLVSDMNNFSDDNGKRLAWEPEGPSKSINFLDLTIMIDEHGRCTCTSLLARHTHPAAHVPSYWTRSAATMLKTQKQTILYQWFAYSSNDYKPEDTQPLF